MELGGEIVSYYDLNGVSLVFVHLSVKKVVVTHLTAKEIIGTYFETERLMVTHLVTKGLVVARGRERFFPRGYKVVFFAKMAFSDSHSGALRHRARHKNVSLDSHSGASRRPARYKNFSLRVRTLAFHEIVFIRNMVPIHGTFRYIIKLKFS